MCIRTEILTVEDLRRNVLSNKMCFHFHDYSIYIYIYIHRVYTYIYLWKMDSINLAYVVRKLATVCHIGFIENVVK